MEYIINSPKYGKLTVLLDKEDYDFLIQNGYKLRRCKTKNDFFYIKARSYKLNQDIFLPRLIMNCPKGKEVDHINHNVLDNRKCNLRIVTHTENNRNNKNNSSSVTGVYYRKSKNKYEAFIEKNGKRKWLGTYNTLEEAREVRLRAEELEEKFSRVK